MGIIARMRKQKAIYWAKVPGVRDAMGNPTHDGPVAIDCRWEDKAEQFIGPGGDLETSRSNVYVDRNMIVGSLLLLAPGFAGESGGPLGPMPTMTSIATHGWFISAVATPTDPDMADYLDDDPKNEYGAWEIRKMDVLPSISADEFLKKAVL